ncbi:FliA/WhiG family RNA polymerase sigma factor [Demequina capsici]|uniref:RNA polymerase sigma factor n=1 Tax=Demequina capsici TaxID=3075620 RepID=A0AA96F5D2_9MICO|nr:MULTISPECIES: FliA/WhiG family RNA polymerase sigma factor [unclassified Demequina]WNM23423.1 FliA/WhiG family RNA polymerase sigma factor [Demequina sp. OYTSA14]WNM26300.1 FliA/WhiG family RNA polymerase sigma factor [Demequina sp. PMTSA13]
MSELNTVLKHLETQQEPHVAVEDRTPSDLDPRWTSLRSADPEERREARDGLITDFAPLVTHVATRMIGRLPESVELGDLVSYGMFGLIDAVEKFEPARGFKFETYASQRVRGAIIDELRAADWVPRSVRAKARTVEAATRQLEQSVQGPVTDEDVARHLEWQTAEVRTVRAQVALSHVAALDTLGGIGDDTTALDTVAALSVPGAARAVEHHETRSLLADAVQQVREREQEVLRLYYYENLTLAQIGRILGVTESRVSQIHSAAVKKLRETLVKTGAFS